MPVRRCASLDLHLLTAPHATPPLSSLTVQNCGDGHRDRLALMPQHGVQPSLPATPGTPDAGHSRPHRDQPWLTARSCTLVTHTEVSNLEQNRPLVVVVVGGQERREGRRRGRRREEEGKTTNGCTTTSVQSETVA